MTSSALAGALTLTGTTIAVADIGDNIPPTANAGVWNAYTTAYKTQPDWSPQGTIIADTGFRAFPNGFGFFNTGVPDVMNNRVFGASLQGPDNLDPARMRDLMGKRVCVQRSATGTCTLTPAAQLWMDSANDSMSGGHCFGFATTAAELFNNSLRPEQFQTGITRTFDLAPTEPIEREIARNMAAQYMMDIGQRFIMTPRQVVDMLKKGLTPGNAAYTLIMFWPEGGHAITPFALYDRGDGLYDVGVYDNNYPDAERAVRIDTKANTFQYLVGVNPNAAPTIASSGIGLVPVSEIAQRQSCPFCGGVNKTTVKLSAVKSRTPIRTRVMNLNGKKLKGVEVRRPTTPWQPGQKWEFPTYVIPKNKKFVVAVDATKRNKAMRLNVTATTGDIVVGSEDAVVPPEDVAAIGLVPSKGLIVYTVQGPNKTDMHLGELAFVNSMPGGSVVVQAVARTKDSGYLIGRIQSKKARVVLTSADDRPSRAGAQAALSFAEDGQALAVTTGVQTTLAKNAKLVFDYSDWTKNSTKGLRAYVLSKGKRTPLKLTFDVTG